MNQVWLLMLILWLGRFCGAQAAVVALKLMPQYAPGSGTASYDLDQDGSVEFTLGSVTYMTQDYPSSAYTTFYDFGRREGFEMLILPDQGTGAAKLAALDGAGVVGSLSDWSSAAMYLSIISGGSNLSGRFGYFGEFTNFRTAFLGYRLTKDGLDYHGLIQIELYQGELAPMELAQVMDGFLLAPLYGYPNVRVVNSWIETEAGRSISVSSVPEPGRGVLMLLGGLGLLNRRRRAALGAG